MVPLQTTPTTRASLVARLADPGDQVAWQEFVALYEPLVHRLLRRGGLQDADVLELSQEVFLAVSRHVGRFRREHPGGFRGWLRTIARNLLVNLLAKHRRQPVAAGDTDMLRMLSEVPAPDDPASGLFDAELRRRLFHQAGDEVRRTVQPATWQAFWRTAVEGADPAAVAAELRMSSGSVYVAKCRVLARIRSAVEVLASGRDA